jgi:hypothetical protein
VIPSRLRPALNPRPGGDPRPGLSCVRYGRQGSREPTRDGAGSSATVPGNRWWKLQEAFITHRDETEGHVERLEKVFEAIGKKPRGKTCDAILGIIAKR